MSTQPPKYRSSRNRTLTLTEPERAQLRPHLLHLTHRQSLDRVRNRVIHQEMLAALPHLPPNSVDLLILDPPYNLTKTYGTKQFRKLPDAEYLALADQWLQALLPPLKPHASVYVCGDWESATLFHGLLKRYFIIRNRITWEREKGRGAKTNWKNNSEDIWFCTVGKRYTFNSEAVKLKRKVLAPYRKTDGTPKDWLIEKDGQYRLTHASNLWTDISVPFWSMPENTEHPTQKPEKLIAKLILASSHPGDVVLDPFGGSGTTAIVAKKLGRDFITIENDERYACITLKRLKIAETTPQIQGYINGVFYERNAHKK